MCCIEKTDSLQAFSASMNTGPLLMYSDSMKMRVTSCYGCVQHSIIIVDTL